MFAKATKIVQMKIPRK